VSREIGLGGRPHNHVVLSPASSPALGAAANVASAGWLRRFLRTLGGLEIVVPRRWWLWSAGLSGALAAAGVGYLAAVDSRATPRDIAVVGRVSIIVVLVAAGLYAWTSKTHERMGGLLVMAGLFSSVWLLNGSDDPLAFSAGVLASGLAPVVFCSLMLMHPAGELPSPLARRLLALLAGMLGLVWPVLVLTTVQPPLQTPLLRCAPHCPRNVFFVGFSLADAPVLKLAVAVMWIGLAWGTAASVLRRARSSPAPRRHSLAPVSWAAIGYALFTTAELAFPGLGSHVAAELGSASVELLVALPLAILAGLGLERLFTLEADLKSSTADLAASRIRLVETAYAERQRIERDLHDSVQQDLVGLRIKLELAAEVTKDDPGRSRQMVAAVGRQMDDVLEALRSLARGIYPSVLDERGLAEALKSAARRSPRPVSVDARGLRRYPADVEVAVYFCCLEAIQNFVKHAGDGAAAAVRLRHEPTRLWFEVSDSGAGFDPDEPKDRHGLVNMRDRIEAVGGTLSVISSPGRGTSVHGTVPTG